MSNYSPLSEVGSFLINIIKDTYNIKDKRTNLHYYRRPLSIWSLEMSLYQWAGPSTRRRIDPATTCPLYQPIQPLVPLLYPKI